MIQIADTSEKIKHSLPAVLSLRSHLSEEQAFEMINQIQKQENYVLAYINHSDGKAVAFIGFRIITFLFSGKTLYIDDLGTLADYRGHGYASQLLDFSIEYAQKKGCKVVSLDSGANPARYDAHRLYLNKRFNIVSHHFALKL